MSEILDQLGKERGDIVPQEATGEQEHVLADGAGQEDDGDTGIMIGDKKFKTQEEAFAYAQALEQKTTLVEAQSNAYRQAIQDAALAQSNAQKVTQAPPAPEENFDEKFYENPQEFLKNYGEKITKATEDRILGQINAQSAEEKLWGEFFSGHPDLRDFKEDCEGVLARHTEDIRAIHATKGQKAAMDYLAQKTRAKFQSYIEGTKPQRELQKTSAGASMGSSVNVTRNIRQESPVDFISEIKQARGKRG